MVARCIGKLAYLLPLLAGFVPEGLELGGEVTVAGGDAEEHGVEGLEVGGVVQNGVTRLSRSVHLLEDFVGERLRDLEEGGVTASLADALELSIGQCLDMAVHRVVYLIQLDMRWKLPEANIR